MKENFSILNNKLNSLAVATSVSEEKTNKIKKLTTQLTKTIKQDVKFKALRHNYDNLKAAFFWGVGSDKIVTKQEINKT